MPLQNVETIIRTKGQLTSDAQSSMLNPQCSMLPRIPSIPQSHPPSFHSWATPLGVAALNPPSSATSLGGQYGIQTRTRTNCCDKISLIKPTMLKPSVRRLVTCSEPKQSVQNWSGQRE